MNFTDQPCAKITVTFGGDTFTAGQATYANLLDTQDRLGHVNPDARIRVLQPCYNTGVPASAGTHDLDAVLDLEVVGLGWPAAQAFLRGQGWACWWRHTGDWADPSQWHIHAVSLGAVKCGCPVGVFVPAQVFDYGNHALGLAGMHDSGSDPTWHPDDIQATIFRYDQWRQAHMPLNNDDLDKIRAIVRDEAVKAVDDVLTVDMNSQGTQGEDLFDKMNLRTAIKRIYRSVVPS